MNKICICQNLVLNPGFEDFSSCPIFSGEINKANFWDNPTGHIGTSDLYNTCSTNLTTTLPNNLFFYQLPWEGNGVIGLLTFSNFGNNEREYIQGSLSSQLVLDSCYYLSFYSNAIENDYYFQNKLGICLSSSPITQITTGLVLDAIPVFYAENVNSDTMNWTKNESFYVSIGNESIVTIGNFFTDGNFDIDTTNDTSILNSNGSYYLIDNVIVEKRFPKNVYAGDDINIIKENNAFIGDTIYEPAIYSWLPTTGLSDSGSFQTLASPEETTTYILTKTTPCGFSSDTVTVFVYEDEYLFYPNPTSENLTLNYSSGTDALLNVYDLRGRIIIRNKLLPALVNQSITFDVSRFSSGIYLFRISDENGMSIKTEKIVIGK